MVSIRGSLAVLLSLAVLGVLLLSFLFVKLGGDGKDTPKQALSRLTGYPTWHGPEDAAELEKLDSIGVGTLVLLGGVACTALKWTVSQNTKIISTFVSSDDGGRTIPAIIYNRLLALYLFGTFITVAASRVLDDGKVWAPLGLLHNIWEAAILILLAMQGRIASVSFFWLLGVYSLLVLALVLALNFPLDVLWFQVQGLNLDFALAITYWRIWKSTRNNGANDIEELPLENDRPTEDPIHIKLFPATIDYPKSLVIPLIASTVHVTGNVISLLPPLKVKFLFTYLVAFALYWFYLFLDTHVPSLGPQKRMYLPETPTWKFATITIWCLILSFGTIRVGLFLSNAAKT